METRTILAIYPKAKGFGYVALDTPDNLIDYGVVTFRQVTNAKVMKRLNKMLRYLEPDTVITKKPDPKKNNRNTKLAGQIKKWVDKNHMAFAAYSREDIREAFKPLGIKSRLAIAHRLCEQFEELWVLKPKPHREWESEDYNLCLFDALSLVATHQRMY